MADGNVNTYGVVEPNDETLAVLESRNNEYSDARLLILAFKDIRRERDRVTRDLAVAQAQLAVVRKVIDQHPPVNESAFWTRLAAAMDEAAEKARRT
jgi:hypothetical protein